MIALPSTQSEPLVRPLMAYLDYDFSDEPELAEKIPEQPIKLWAVFGQGRLLGPLIEGFDLNTDGVDELSYFCVVRVRVR